jgi:hypothetical protein
MKMAELLKLALMDAVVAIEKILSGKAITPESTAKEKSNK